MEVFHHKKNITYQFIAVIIIICCALGNKAIAAEQYKLKELAQLPNLSDEKIVELVPLPTNDSNTRQYLLVDESGELSLLNDTTLTSLSRLPLNKKGTAKKAKLTALALHPSFSNAEQSGYRTLFTAHIEAAQLNNNVARLTALENPSALPFDAVITQWQFDNATLKTIDTKQRREVIRIAVPNANHKIQQLAFNPGSKAWHDDYGIMHIALSDNTNTSENLPVDALYSGVILRINPAKFGLRNYMVPNNNPFMKTSEINNEILILGAQQIQSFSWSKQHYSSLLIQHSYNSSNLLAVAVKGSDWRDGHQDNKLFPLQTSKKSVSNILSYNGRNLKSLWGSVLYLSHNRKNWQLATIDTTTNRNITDKKVPEKQAASSFLLDEIPSINNVQLLFSHAGEPLLLDQSQKKLLAVVSNESISVAKEQNQLNDDIVAPIKESSSSSYGTLLLTLLLMVMAVIFYRLRPKSNATKIQLRSQFARFDIDKTKTTLSFYKRHQTDIDSQLAIADIVESEVLLNNVSLNTINEHNDNGYNQLRENELRAGFDKEHIHKLIDDNIRQVHLYLTDKNGTMHIVCLYLRQGNQRLTKAKYFDVLETIIDWSWFIAKQLNPQATEKRKVKVPVNKQPAKPLAKNDITPEISARTSDTQANVDRREEAKHAEELHDIAVHDSELINSLDKLVSLKQKGFLNDEEFSLAKAKILTDITREK